MFTLIQGLNEIKYPVGLWTQQLRNYGQLSETSQLQFQVVPYDV